jgi:hypothetical protein
MHLCEYSYGEVSGSTKDREFLHKMSDYQLLKDSSAPWCYLSITLREMEDSVQC